MHPEALTDKGRAIFSKLKTFRGFYLAGGTALALQLKHRVSVDFDLFTSKEISKRLYPSVQKTFSGFKVAPSVNNRDELTVFVSQIKVTFLRYPFPVMRDFVLYQGLPLMDPVELAATKAYTIGRRGAFKDYVDLYFVLKEQVATLKQIMGLALRKYQENFNSRLFLEQLVYLADLEEAKVRFLKKAVTKKQIESFFIRQIKEMKL